MLRLSVENLLPGMRVGLPIYHPKRTGSILLNRGSVLSAASISHFVKMKLRTIWIEHPSFGMVKRFIRPGIMQTYEELRVSADDIINSLVSSDGINWPKREVAKSIIQRMILEMVAERAPLVYVDDPPPSDSCPLYTHAASTCFLTALLSLQMHSFIQRERRTASATPHQEELHLCMGAFLHDIGLYQIPVSSFERWIESGEENEKAWQLHVKHGYDLVNRFIESAGATAVLNHHQYFDYTGFPPKINWEGKEEAQGGSDVHIFARVVTAADQFDELKHRPSGEVCPTVRALKHFIDGCVWSRVDPRAGRALLQVVPAYLPGTEVRLSSGDRGIVVDWKPGNPCQPSVAVIGDYSELICSEDDWKRADEAKDSAEDDELNIEHQFTTIDLAMETELSIVEAEGVDVSEDQFTLPSNLRPMTKAGEAFGVLEAA